MIVARSFFETSIPEELFDAAKLDGMSYLGYFVRIVLPLSSAILAVIGLYYFVGHWNDFMTGLIYVTDWDKQPLQNILQQLLLVNQNTTMANVGSLASHFDEGLAWIARTSLGMVVAHPLCSLMLLCTIFLIGWVCCRWPGVFVGFGFSLLVFAGQAVVYSFGHLPGFSPSKQEEIAAKSGE